MTEAINLATNSIGVSVSAIINSAVKVATKQELLALNIYRANIKTEAEAQKAIAAVQKKLEAQSVQEAAPVAKTEDIKDVAEISQAAKTALAEDSSK